MGKGKVAPGLHGGIELVQKLSGIDLGSGGCLHQHFGKVAGIAKAAADSFKGAWPLLELADHDNKPAYVLLGRTQLLKGGRILKEVFA